MHHISILAFAPLAFGVLGIVLSFFGVGITCLGLFMFLG